MFSQMLSENIKDQGYFMVILWWAQVSEIKTFFRIIKKNRETEADGVLYPVYLNTQRTSSSKRRASSEAFCIMWYIYTYINKNNDVVPSNLVRKSAR